MRGKARRRESSKLREICLNSNRMLEARTRSQVKVGLPVKVKVTVRRRQLW